MNDWKQQAEAIEYRAAKLAYDCGMGAGEWEAFLSRSQVTELVKYAEAGYGTWANEPEVLARMKRALADSACNPRPTRNN